MEAIVLNYEKAVRYTVAGCFGLIGFAITYVTLGWIIQPVEEWIQKRMGWIK